MLCINQQLGSQLQTLFPETLQNIITRFFHLINSVNLVKSEDYCSHCSHQSLHFFCGPDHPGSYVTGVGRESIALQKGIT
jgi:hypothetical protein